MARLKVQLFGSFQVHLNEALITKFESNKVRALLAYLIVESQEAHSREKLAALFWHEMPPKRASSNLSQAIYNLRHLLEDHQLDPPFFLRSRDSIQFNRDSEYWLDVEHFNQNLFQDQALVASDDGYHENLQHAIELYRGDFLEGLSFDSSLSFDEWVFVLRQRFQRQVLDGLHQLAAYYAAQNELPKALPLAWRQVEVDPLDERSIRQLMQLLAANDQRSQALTQFERLQIMLADELKVAPEPETIALHHLIRGGFRSIDQTKTRADNLPAFLTPLIGRQQELIEILDQCRKLDCRLLSILGPGGSGKTRLALEAAKASLEHFDHGVFFVPLNPVQSPASVLPAILKALDLPLGEHEDAQNQLENYLRNKNLLLVLDGFEHLLEAAGWIAGILHQASQIQILVTTRTRLKIKSEQVFMLSGLQYPKEGNSQIEIQQSDAVQLFVASLRRTRPDYDLSLEDYSYLIQICQQVCGMPLGILLAASWGATLNIKEIANMVCQSLDYLTSDWTDVPERQRSLRATFDYTWNLLGKKERNFFQSLSVFRGSFSRRAASMVSGASAYELRDLVERSLLWCRTPGWYEVHELLRQFGREKLGQSAQVEKEICDRHSNYYLKQLTRLGDDLKSSQQVAALTSIDLEHENYRTAWNWAASQGMASYLGTVVEPICLYYEISLRFQDGKNACEMAIKALPKKPDNQENLRLLMGLYTWQSRFSRLLGQPDVASQLMEKDQACLQKAKLAEYKVHNVEAFILLEQGNTHFHKDRCAAAACYLKALELYRSLDDSWGSAKTFARMGLLAHHAGNFKEAVQCYSESLELYRASGDPRGIANALIGSGQNSLRLGLAEQGERYIDEGVALLQQIGDRVGVARGYFELARYYFWIGDFTRSVQLNGTAAIPIFEDLGILDQYIFASIGLGLGFSHLGRYSEAISRVVTSLPLAQEQDARREIGLANVILGMAYLGQSDFEEAENWAHKSVKQYRDLNQQEELSLALSILVYTQLGLDQSRQAEIYLSEILCIAIDISGIYPILYILLAASLTLMKRGDIGLALEIFAMAERYPFVGNSRWFEDIAGREIAAIAKTLPPEIATAARERGQARDIWETAAELLKEFT